MEDIINVFGLGTVGLPLASVIANSGLLVYGIDINKERVEQIKTGHNPIKEEPGIDELLKKCVNKNLIVTTSVANTTKKANVHIIIVPLLIDNSKKPDFKFIDAAIADISSVLKKDDLVVVETTVPVTSTETIIKTQLEEQSGLKAGVDFCLAFSPEYSMTGYSISRFETYPKIIGGINEESAKRCYDVYSNFCKNPKIVKDIRTAELIKIVVGLYRDVNIALANEVYKVCERYGIDFKTIRQNSKQEFVDIHETGNVGGHCVPLYPWFLINDLPKDTILIKTARNINDNMLNFFIDKLQKITKTGKVAIIGLTFRSGVKEIKYSRTFPLINLLRELGYDIYVNDPLFSRQEIEEMDFKFIDTFEDVDAVILMNKYPQYTRQLHNIRHKVVDTKNAL